MKRRAQGSRQKIRKERRTGKSKSILFLKSSIAVAVAVAAARPSKRGEINYLRLPSSLPHLPANRLPTSIPATMASFVGSEILPPDPLSQRPSVVSVIAYTSLSNNLTEGLPQNALATSDLVTISSSEYQRLLETSRQLTTLKDSLLSGGLSQETLDLIIFGAPTSSSDVPENDHKEPIKKQVSTTRCSKTYAANSYKTHTVAVQLDDDEGALTDSRSDERDDYGESSRSTESSSPQAEQRTVIIRNLPDKITHRDIVDTVKGGAILHIYLWARDRTASVSFVEETAAHSFLEHAKTYGLYVADKRVEVLWNDRQFYLPPFVRSNISNGASRNLVVYNANPSITEGLIKEDLEHIHNLIVISVKFKFGNVYISTNSVHNALFARSCMMSRLTYKGMKIAFYPDECAESLAKIPTGPKKVREKEKDTPAASKKPVKLPNRFHLLALDGSEDEDEDHHGVMVAGINGRVCWTDNSVSA
ncbi:hypothetical protein BJX99DRAFT_170426 [Aspergillus californicus]